MRVFISYAPREASLANRLGHFLRGNGVTPFSVNLKMSLGDDLFHRLEYALQHPNHILVLLSGSYLRDKWLQKELFAFVTKELTSNAHGLILPVLAQQCLTWPRAYFGRIGLIRRWLPTPT
jgi:hypothetical protein